MKILLIDDSSQTKHLLSDNFAAHGMTLFILESSSELKDYPFDQIDTVLLEYSLHKFDGIEALELLAKKGFEGQLLLKSPYGKVSRNFFVEQAREHGFIAPCLLSNCSAQEIMDKLQSIKKVHETPSKRVTRKLVMEAFEQNQFNLVYQPQYNMLTKECVGLEVLTRWYSPQLGHVSPMELISKIDKYEMHARFNQWLFNQALKETSESHLSNYNLAFNLSVNHLNDLSTAQLVLNTLSYYQAERELITIEVTEDAVLHGNHDCKRALQLLKSSGLKISLDDFGTGFSSLQQLLEFQFDEFKLDRCFTANCQTDLKSKTILETVLTLSSKFSLPLVIEGIENLGQEQYISRLGGLIGQGYFYCKPLAAFEVSEFLSNRKNADNNMLLPTGNIPPLYSS